MNAEPSVDQQFIDCAHNFPKEKSPMFASMPMWRTRSEACSAPGNPRRITTLAALLLLSATLAGCASPQPPQRKPVKNQIPFDQIIWQEPTETDAVVYLMRAPNDATVWSPTMDDVPGVALALESYTAVRVQPGTHRLGARNAGQPNVEAVPLNIELNAGERRFFYLGTVLKNKGRLSSKATGVIVGTTGLVGLAIASAAASANPSNPEGFGSYRWTEFNERDARGLASISTLLK